MGCFSILLFTVGSYFCISNVAAGEPFFPDHFEYTQATWDQLRESEFTQLPIKKESPEVSGAVFELDYEGVSCQIEKGDGTILIQNNGQKKLLFCDPSWSIQNVLFHQQTGSLMVIMNKKVREGTKLSLVDQQKIVFKPGFECPLVALFAWRYRIIKNTELQK